MRNLLLIVLLLLLPVCNNPISAQEQPQKSTVQDSLSFRILFRVNSTTVRPEIFDNRTVLEEFASRLNELSQDESVTNIHLTIRGNASLEGNAYRNKVLAANRSKAIRSYLVSNLSIPDSLITVITDRSIRSMRIEADSLLNTFTEAIPGIDLEGIRRITSTVHDGQLKLAFVGLDGMEEGPNWVWYKRNVLDFTRFAQIRLGFDNILPLIGVREAWLENPSAAGALFSTRLDAPDGSILWPKTKEAQHAEHEAATVQEALQQSAEHEAAPVQEVLQQSAESGERSGFRVGTNLLYDVATVANLSVEYGFANRLAVNISGTFSPWDIRTPDIKLRTVLLQPEVRWYFADDFKGHYVGVEGHLGWYNVALGGKIRYQDRDGNTPLWGAGLSYGYVLMLAEHLGIDFGISAGYANLSYDCYYNLENGLRFTSSERGWWGPTRVGVSIFYKF